jgi:hypothetical protein
MAKILRTGKKTRPKTAIKGKRKANMGIGLTCLLVAVVQSFLYVRSFRTPQSAEVNRDQTA